MPPLTVDSFALLSSLDLFVRLGTALDVWGFGCVFAELTLREPLFRGECEIDQLLLIFR